MNKSDLLSSTDLPIGFSYPREFIYVLSLGIENICPWHFIDGEELKHVFVDMCARYPSKGYIPFAKRQDNDDTACWVSGEPAIVVIVHDYCTNGHERREEFKSFYDWFKQAIDDLIEFDT